MSETNVTDFTDLFIAGLNNPECSFFVGAWAGGYFALKILIGVLVGYALLKAIDKLA